MERMKQLRKSFEMVDIDNLDPGSVKKDDKVVSLLRKSFDQQIEKNKFFIKNPILPENADFGIQEEAEEVEDKP